MPVNEIIPNIEKRLSGWLDIQDRQARQDLQVQEPITITISREFGCQGYPLAEALKSELENKSGENWSVFDKSLISMISKDNHISEHILAKLGEKSKYLDYIVASLMPGWKSEDEAYTLITRAIYAIARRGNAIIVGRGAFAVTQTLKNCYHYRLIAPLDFRVKTYSELCGVQLDEAKKTVRENSSNRNNFMRDFYNCFFNGNEFNMIFNNSLMTVENIAQTIIFSLKDVLPKATAS